jgi:hypothetical protein
VVLATLDSAGLNDSAAAHHFNNFVSELAADEARFTVAAAAASC